MASIRLLEAVWTAAKRKVRIRPLSHFEKLSPPRKPTSHASDVVVELFLQPGGTVLLAGEVGQVLVEDLVAGSVHLAEVL